MIEIVKHLIDGMESDDVLMYNTAKTDLIKYEADDSNFGIALNEWKTAEANLREINSLITSGRIMRAAEIFDVFACATAKLAECEEENKTGNGIHTEDRSDIQGVPPRRFKGKGRNKGGRKHPEKTHAGADNHKRGT